MLIERFTIGRVERYTAALQSNPIDLKNLRKLAIQGIPEDCGLRALYWKVLVPQYSILHHNS
jgi:hypothetical protein